MTSRTLEFPINRANIVDQVAALLYATGKVYDNENISDIQFGDLSGQNELVSLKVILNKPQEVEFIQHNG